MSQQVSSKDKLYYSVLEKEVTIKDLDNKVRYSTLAIWPCLIQNSFKIR